MRTIAYCYVRTPNRKSDPSRGFVSRMRFNLGNWLKEEMSYISRIIHKYLNDGAPICLRNEDRNIT